MVTISERDHEALERALQLTLFGQDRVRAEQVRTKLKEEGWHEAAVFCSYVRQAEHLSLSPWEDPPVFIDEDKIDEIISRGANANTQFGGAKLLKKMLAAGISIYDPTPIDSLAAATRKP